MLYVVGFGAGGYDGMTLEAKQVLDESNIIAGYTVYVDMLKPFFKEKEFYSTPMKQEIDRCKWAIEEAAKGKVVSMICSGDSGVYGMASLIYELAETMCEIEIQVVPGVTAACSGGAVLGAPLSHDFAVISLSDLLTPYEVIEKRIACAAMSDLVICLYNPSSKKRHHYLQKACDIVLKYQKSSTVCGYVRNIKREEETNCVLTLSQLREREVDMFTTVFIGNSTTRNINGKMVTPRGYHTSDE